MKYRMFWMAAAVCMALGAGGCGKPSVSVMPAVKKEVPFVYEAEIRPEALHSVPIVPQVSGNITSTLPDVGSQVQAGQLLLQLDASAYESQAAAMEAKIASSQAPAPAPVYEAPVDDSMEASLLRQGIITRAEYNRIQGRRAPSAPQAGAPAAPSVSEGDMAALQALRRAIADCTILSPIDGIVAQVYVSDQKAVSAGQPALVIRQNSPVTANVQIPAVLDDVLRKAKDSRMLTVTISDKDHGGTWYGELKPQPNTSGDDYTVYKVQADNPDDAIEIGNLYNLRIESGQNVPGYVVPSKAFIGRDQLKIVNEKNLVDMRTVVVASDDGESRLVVSGLRDGDRIITAPSDDLELGTEVNVK